LIGENRTFDHIFATYQPKHGQSIANLLSEGIIHKSGIPGPHFIRSLQYQINQPYPSTYFIDALVTKGKTLYQQSPLTPPFPVPNTAYVPSMPGPLSQGQAPFDSSVPDSELPTIEPSLEKSDLGLLRTGASGLPMNSNDTRVTNAAMLPNGVFQITGSTLPYDSFTGDMVHRLFHIWQQSDCDVMNATASNPSGCLNDLYPFVGVARNDGSGSNSMGFYNMRRAGIQADRRRIHHQ
jgi:phospholipase C